MPDILLKTTIDNKTIVTPETDLNQRISAFFSLKEYICGHFIIPITKYKRPRK